MSLTDPFLHPPVPVAPWDMTAGQALGTIAANLFRFADILPNPDHAILMTDPATIRPPQVPVVLATQIPVRVVARTRSLNHASSQPRGKGTSIAQSSPPDRLSIVMSWYSDNFADSSPRKARETLDELLKPDGNGEYPILLLVWGSLSFRCQIANSNELMELGVDAVSMSERKFSAELSLVEVYQEPAQSLGDQLGEPSTTWHDAIPSDTWATLALLYYGTPDASVRLAEANRGRTLEIQDGERIKVLPATHSEMTGPASPASVQLQVIPVAELQELAVLRAQSSLGGVDWIKLDPRFTADDWTE